MTGEGGERKEVDLKASEDKDLPTVILPEAGNEEPAGPGQSPLDEGLARLSEASAKESGDE